eukprot:619418-Amorphochlora_amoeboformis.AAC.1
MDEDNKVRKVRERERKMRVSDKGEESDEEKRATAEIDQIEGTSHCGEEKSGKEKGKTEEKTFDRR